MEHVPVYYQENLLLLCLITTLFSTSHRNVYTIHTTDYLRFEDTEHEKINNRKIYEFSIHRCD